MDPLACLIACDQAISDLDLDAARERLRDYSNWRRRGGFEPIDVAGTTKRGDAFATWCWHRLDDIERQQRLFGDLPSFLRQQAE